MRRIATVLALGLLLLLTCQCASSSQLRKAQKGAKPVKYTVLENYYVRNDVYCKDIQRLIIDNEQDFKAFFGTAALMGGQPTDINWNHQYVIAVILPKTNRPTMVTPLWVKQNENNVIFKYEVNRGSKTSYWLVPFAAIALDKPAEPQQVQVFYIEK
jgi:hypothetical protein